MEATLCLSKPLHLFTSQSQKPTIINLHHNVSFHHRSSYPGSNLHRKMQVGDYLSMAVGVGPLFWSVPLTTCPQIVGMKDPTTGRRKSLVRRRRTPSWRSLTVESLIKGHLSLDLLLEAKKARLYPRFLDSAVSQFDDLLQKEFIPFDELKEAARKLEMSGKEDEAVEMLNATLERIYSQHKGSEEIFQVKLLLAEMLIYQGEYEEARKIGKEIDEGYIQEAIAHTPGFDSAKSVPVQHFGPSNSRLLLLRAVTNAMLGDLNTARLRWDEYTSWKTERGLPEEPPVVSNGEVKEHTLNSDQFLDHMSVLKNEIENARRWG